MDDYSDYIPFIMFGTWLALVVSAILFSKRRMRRELLFRKAAFSAPHKYRVASLMEYPALSQDVYDEAEAVFERLGYRHVGDIVDETMAASPYPPETVMSVHISEEGSFSATFQQEKAGALARRLQPAARHTRIRFFAEAEDGRVFSVEKIARAKRFVEPERFTVAYFDGDMGVDEVYAEFDRLFRQFLSSHADFFPVKFKLVDDVVASLVRQDALRVAFRRANGLMLREEMLLRGVSPQSVDGMVRKFNKAAAASENERV